MGLIVYLLPMIVDGSVMHIACVGPGSSAYGHSKRLYSHTCTELECGVVGFRQPCMTSAEQPNFQAIGTFPGSRVYLVRILYSKLQFCNIVFKNHLPRSLYTLLGTRANQSCKLPNDRVYALLGLQPEEVLVEPITVKTEIATEKLYIDTTKRIIDSDLSILVCCSASIGHGGEVHNLPSWVPDWTGKRLTVVFETVCRPYFFSADGGRRVLTPSK